MNVLSTHLNTLKGRYLRACYACALWTAGYTVLAFYDLRVAVGVRLVEWAQETLAGVRAGA